MAKTEEPNLLNTFVHIFNVVNYFVIFVDMINGENLIHLSLGSILFFSSAIITLQATEPKTQKIKKLRNTTSTRSCWSIGIVLIVIILSQIKNFPFYDLYNEILKYGIRLLTIGFGFYVTCVVIRTEFDVSKSDRKEAKKMVDRAKKEIFKEKYPGDDKAEKSKEMKHFLKKEGKV